MTSQINTNMFLLFQIGTQSYAIEITSIREILTYQDITEVPENADWLRGVINLRGTAMPIIDLRIRFKTNLTPKYNDKTIIIATKIHGGKYIGYVIDEINDIETIAPSELLPYDEGRIDTINAKFLKGYINKKDRMTVILDTDKILKNVELAELNSNERLIA